MSTPELSIIRQSDIKLWQKCPLAWYFQNIEQIPRLQGGALTYGSILHHCIEYLEETGDLQGALARFDYYWRTPEALDPRYKVEYYHRGASWVRYANEGPEILKGWANLVQWDADLVLAREYPFTLPIGNQGHHLHGTVDKLVISYHQKTGKYVVKVVDYKSNRTVPKYNDLEEDVQFSAYCLSPETPVLLADLTWRPIGLLAEGDEVLATDEHPTETIAGVKRRHWRSATVEKVWTVRKEAFRVELSDGRSFVASGSHRFLAQESGRWAWRTVDDMARVLHDSRRKTSGIRVARAFRPGDNLGIDYHSDEYMAGYLAGATLGDGAIRAERDSMPFWQIGLGAADTAILDRIQAYATTFGIRLHRWHREPNGRGWQRSRMEGLRTNARADVEALASMAEGGSLAWRAGWLAGLYDTDGSLGSTLQYFQKDVAVLKRVVAYAADLGFEATIDEGPIKSVARITGDRTERARFCQVVRPALTRKLEKLAGTTTRIFGDARITAITSVGEQTLVDITTTTGTFIADGVISHNCWATTQPEFWRNLPGGRGMELYEQYKHLPRRGEWVQLTVPRRMDAGERIERHYRRLEAAVNAIKASVAMGIFIPTLSGECTYCDFRGPCGLPPKEEDDA